jgi:hypothetical protein
MMQSLVVVLTLSTLILGASPARSQTREVFFGDTHLHSSWSPDALLMGNRSADPDTAYRFARGLPVVHPAHQAKVRIDTPLDFLAVSDHAEFMGVLPMIFAGDPRVAESDTARRFVTLASEGKISEAMRIMLGQFTGEERDPALVSEEITSSVWREIIDAAERHNEPGRFTTLLAWEWSSMPDLAHLHRVVLVRGGKAEASHFRPYSYFDSPRPEDLWAWLEETSKRSGAQFLAIPHNSNLSLGRMFSDRDSEGVPITAEYAKTRMQWEPVAEITQVKGDSETHPLLSPDDEFADFETFGATLENPTFEPGDYLRAAMLRGLEIGRKTGTNPYAFGLIGSTDDHTGLSSAEEENFQGKYAAPSTPASNFAPSVNGSIRGIELAAAGLAGVWAEENTRESLFDAFRRREVYGTTGPRLRVQMFGGWTLERRDLEANDFALRGYAKGVPMGGVLAARDGRAPRFLVHATKDPTSGNLDRIQIVKGWVDVEGQSHERIYDVALSDGRERAADGSVPPAGTTVDLATAAWSNDIGAPRLSAHWEDPDFDADQAAFYYARVLEIPTPRHSLYDAVALNVPHPEEFPATIQERAYTSPIWYRP